MSTEPVIPLRDLSIPKMELQMSAVLVLFAAANPCYHFPFLYDDKSVTVSRRSGSSAPVCL
jgi:hypothetical protein